MSDFDDRMAALRQSFVARAREARALLGRARAGNDHDVLRQTAHNLAGNAGIFGFPEVTDAARALEEALDEPVDTAALDTLVGTLDDRLAALDSA